MNTCTVGQHAVHWAEAVLIGECASRLSCESESWWFDSRATIWSTFGVVVVVMVTEPHSSYHSILSLPIPINFNYSYQFLSISTNPINSNLINYPQFNSIQTVRHTVLCCTWVPEFDGQRSWCSVWSVRRWTPDVAGLQFPRLICLDLGDGSGWSAVMECPSVDPCVSQMHSHRALVFNAWLCVLSVDVVLPVVIHQNELNGNQRTSP